MTVEELKEDLRLQYIGSLLMGNGYWEYMDYRYIVDREDRLVITDYIGEPVESLVIPECFDIIEKLNNSSAFKGLADCCTALTLKRIELSNIEEIRASCFYEYSSLEYVKGDKVKKVENSAFNYCSGLGEVYFPSCNLVGELAFNHCGRLKTVTLGKYVVLGNGAFRQCPRAALV